MTRRRSGVLAVAFGLVSVGCASAGVPEQATPAQLMTVNWPVDNLAVIGGYKTTPIGSPSVTADAPGHSVCFNGKPDALALPVNPLHEQTGFSIQLLVKVLPGGHKTQTVLHIEEAIGDSRVLFELKRSADERWLVQGMLRNKTGYEKVEPPTASVSENEWHWIGMTYGAGMLRFFVDGKQVAEVAMLLTPMGAGKLQLGAHQDPKNWFKGCVKELRFANGALPVDQLARPAPSPMPTPTPAPEVAPAAPAGPTPG